MTDKLTTWHTAIRKHLSVTHKPEIPFKISDSRGGENEGENLLGYYTV
jgi:hypothetical protein